MNEKVSKTALSELQHSSGSRFRSQVVTVTWLLLDLAALFTLIRWVWVVQGSKTEGVSSNDNNANVWADFDFRNVCQQVPPLLPSQNNSHLLLLEEFLLSDRFKNESVARLSGAVQVRTESFDDLGSVGDDPRWDVFYNFASYLKATYPLVHDTFELQHVNTHGLVYTWRGSDTTLKPTMLMAHQDTVPVDASSLDQWIYPPWSGHFDGHYVWGRGSIDCKSQLTAIMDAAELLIQYGFQPERSLILAFGFDEESSGIQGAGYIGRHLEERFGHNSLAVIVDEGSPLERKWGGVFALPAVGEKGSMDVEIEVRTPSGHSSSPPDHTSIGIISDLITHIESKPFLPFLRDENPYLAQMKCGAAHGPEFPPALERLLQEREKDKLSAERRNSPFDNTALTSRDPLAEEAAKESRGVRYLMQTSQAVDIIAGGVKVNVLPEKTSAVINYRINIGQTTSDIQQHLALLAAPIAEKYNLTFHNFPSSEIMTEEESYLTLRSLKQQFSPAPVTPTDTTQPSPYAVLAGTIRAVFGDNVIVAPGIMTGNTDTRHLWGLTKHIFRFGVALDQEADRSGVHSTNERQAIGAHITGIQWMIQFIRNMDDARFEE
ncbi:unnamed protein product [Clonostachys byssicola]|uniref:Peptidase M20 dimerisation domain-containing protein n=1 Tax=Clonostachys byssicola TaxID=160290 RepID=A0A9N9URN8_9HYPO|nr:unnamed protein product [Clonostachys byssicola]